MNQQNWHPYFRELWEHCRAKPDAVEDHPWGETVFKIQGRVFAFLGGTSQGGCTVKAPADQLAALLQISFVKRAKYVGRFGWVSLAVDDDMSLNLAVELIDASYEQIANTRSGRKKSARRSVGGLSKVTSRKARSTKKESPSSPVRKVSTKRSAAKRKRPT